MNNNKEIEKTTDNVLVKFKLYTFIGLMLATISISSTISGIIFSSAAQGETIEKTDGRVTKIGNRNAKAIEDNLKNIDKLSNRLYEFEIELLRTRIKELQK